MLKTVTIIAVILIAINLIWVTLRQEEQKSELDSRKVTSLRKLFTSTGLSTALLSFVTTMHGLQLYIFQDNFISAFVLSGAVQGALFAISTNFYGIINKFSGKLSKGAFMMIWLLLLLFSSGFSYVGISGTAYTEEAFREDAEQVMLQYCLNTDYELLEYVGGLEKEYQDKMYVYLNTLNGGENGFVVSEQDRKILETEKKQLQDYQEISSITTADGIDVDISEISDILNTDMLRIYIDSILSGQYGNDLETYKGKLREVIDNAEDVKENLDEQYEHESKLISGDPDSEKEEAKVGYNGRLYQFHDLSNPNYLDLKDRLEKAEKNRDTYKELRDILDKYINYLKECESFIEKDFEKGAENAIYQDTNRLREVFNMDDINTDLVMSLSEGIYNKLVENNTPATDPKISEYVSFKSAVKGYEDIIDQKERLDGEIAILSEYSSELLLQNKENMDTQSDKDVALDTATDMDTSWRKEWCDHLFQIQSVLQHLPEKSERDLQMPKEKSEYLEEIFERRRLYLTDIKEFDKAWSLLFSGFHPKKNKLMLYVSVIIAFGLDLISFAMGCILSVLKVEEKRNAEQVSAGE